MDIFVSKSEENMYYPTHGFVVINVIHSFFDPKQCNSKQTNKQTNKLTNKLISKNKQTNKQTKEETTQRKKELAFMGGGRRPNQMGVG